MRIHYAASKTTLGRVLIGATERGICFLQFADDARALRQELRAEFPNAQLKPMENAQKKAFSAWRQSLEAYLAGKSQTLELPLDIRGTAFQALVWKYLQTIPSGQVQSYSAIAKTIGKPSAARAVASACAANHIAIAIPCHRVVGGNGRLAGYRWGLRRKRRLLEWEHQASWTCRQKGSPAKRLGEPGRRVGKLLTQADEWMACA